jgi:hypothetical protein
MIRYVTKPPTLFDNVPLFILKRYINDELVENLVAWSNKEYYDLVGRLYSDGNKDLADHVQYNCTNLDFIAHTKAFQIMLNCMTPDMWNKFSRASRNILIGANNILKEEGR